MKIPRHIIPAASMPILRFSKRVIVQAWGKSIYRLNQFVPVRHLNLGGGLFVALGWRNLEAVPSYVNPNPFTITPECDFPFDEGTLETVYSSHALEHMDSATVGRALEESYRVLQSGGKLVIKLPDFEHTLQCWKEGEAGYFDDNWGYSQVLHTWKNKNVQDNLNSRAAFVFCGFWNDVYGDHFEKMWSDNNPALDSDVADKPYHGPPLASLDVLREIRELSSPKEVSERLSNIVRETEPDYNFNHQNAWGRKELRELVAGYGFKVLSQDTEFILCECKGLSGIEEMLPISMYLLAQKPE